MATILALSNQFYAKWRPFRVFSISFMEYGGDFFSFQSVSCKMVTILGFSNQFHAKWRRLAPNSGKGFAPTSGRGEKDDN